jgi:Uma2 family endonuclease
LISGEELARMGDLGRCELIDGRIVRMSPSNYEHGGIEVNLAVLLKAFVRQRKLGRVLAGDVGIYTQRNPDRVRGADVAFVGRETYSRRTRRLAFLDVAPELMVEVLSPEDRAMDVTQKLREYFEIGVRLVWLVDPKARVVSAYRSLPEIRELKEGDRLTGDDVLPGFDVPVAEVFEE